MNNPTVSNPNDFKVVEFHNPYEFTFTPEMGCMYDGRPISGITGAPGINGGESMTLPYHIAHQLAVNLAKIALTKEPPTLDAAGLPAAIPIWDTAKLDTLKGSYLTELYTEEKPLIQSETDRLMAKVEELRKFVADNISTKEEVETVTIDTLSDALISTPEGSTTFADKAEVIAELQKRGIAYDARSSKANLEKLLTDTPV